MPVKPRPDGYHTATPVLIVNGAARAIEFYQRAFGAKELMRFDDPSGRVAHAEIKIGDSTIMLADEFPKMEFKSPESLGGTTGSIHLYVENVDAVAQQAVAAGARQVRPVENQFYGDRSGTFADPFGHLWNVATHVEDVSMDELQKRMKKAMAQTV
jgi:PhnB protein